MAAIAEAYRRKLPSPPAIEFASPEGKVTVAYFGESVGRLVNLSKYEFNISISPWHPHSPFRALMTHRQLFAEALAGGNMEGFFKLISYYQTQSEPAYCGLATLSMVLNALAIDPGRKWKGPWRWFDDTMLDCCEPLEKVKINGIPFNKVACLASCNGAEVKDIHTNESSIQDFRNYVVSCTSSEDHHLIVSYHRGYLSQTGSGHFSPIGGYHAAKDLVLILDVARFKYPPHWVPLTLLWDAMNTIDEATGLHRGFMILVKPQIAPTVLHIMNCHNKSWVSAAKYLTKDLPHILSSEQIEDVQGLLATVMGSAPADLKEFTNWVAEVRLQEDGSELTEEEKARISLKEEVLNLVHETPLFQLVTEFLVSRTRSKYSVNSNEKDSLAKIASEAFPQGGQIFCSMFGSSDMPCCNCEMDTEDCEIDVLIPHCKMNSNGHCHCGSSNVARMHPSSVHVLTILLLALPPQTWLSIKHKSLKEEINRLTSTIDLPPLLQEQVLHLQKQLHFLSKSICICSP